MSCGAPVLDVKLTDLKRDKMYTHDFVSSVSECVYMPSGLEKQSKVAGLQGMM